MQLRMRYVNAWRQFYAELLQSNGPDASVLYATRAARELLGRMRALGRKGGVSYQGYNVRELRGALGIALSIHKQVLAGLASAPGRGIMEGGGRVQAPAARVQKSNRFGRSPNTFT